MGPNRLATMPSMPSMPSNIHSGLSSRARIDERPSATLLWLSSSLSTWFDFASSLVAPMLTGVAATTTYLVIFLCDYNGHWHCSLLKTQEAAVHLSVTIYCHHLLIFSPRQGPSESSDAAEQCHSRPTRSSFVFILFLLLLFIYNIHHLSLYQPSPDWFLTVCYLFLFTSQH
ncbi:hypothetical protein SODALDRAFT_92600 [Sodiomyces alkalinus F11]|uniref:Uncharacterized protein n=1 Tax=Sodiomyces alkalinus (strain CBS 110278 / VKM F-3762 / F11) TaxID=1314773 RepID=A0A3N2Q0Q4_SODAK|nr:hypothetical protein SODALDRAFT_92600 [Sodiomyces alkalinus F11]ROT40276.1 hypothetical protein SODALDRAFT_92600 [Sodiomyces alkalinus F11]